MDNERVANNSVNVSNAIDVISIGAILLGAYIENSLLVAIPAWYSVIMNTIGVLILLFMVVTINHISTDALSPDTAKKTINKYSESSYFSFSRVLGWLVVVSLFIAGLVYIPVYLVALELVAIGTTRYLATIAFPKFIEKSGE